MQIAGVVTLVSIVQLNHLTHEFGLKLQLSEPTAGQAVRDVEEGEDQPQDSSSSTTRVEEEDTSQIVQSPTAEELSLVNLNLPQKDKERLKRAAHILRQRLILRLWLDDHGLLEYAAK